MLFVPLDDAPAPHEAHRRLAGTYRTTFILESREGPRRLARFSFVGFDPAATIRIDRDGVHVTGALPQPSTDQDPVEYLRRVQAFYHVDDHETPFVGGLVGSIGHDAVRLFEPTLDDGQDEPWARFMLGLYLDAIVYDLMRRVVDRLAAGDLPWRPGARELLAACREAKIPTALVTMSWRPLTDAALAGIESAVPDPFVITVAGDEVSESKPSPAPYLLAARRLGVDPTRCIAIEDSPTGTASAVAAGCATIGVESHAPLAPRPGLHILPTLAGVGIGDLEAVLASHR